MNDRNQDVQIMRAIRDLDTAEANLNEELQNAQRIMSAEFAAKMMTEVTTALRAVRQARARLRSI